MKLRTSALKIHSVFTVILLSFLSAKANGQENVALGKLTFQSSDWEHDSRGQASLAVDGNTNGVFGAGSVTHTTDNYGYGELNPWWEVSLGGDYSIGKIVVWNRSDCCGSRVDNFQLTVKRDDMDVNTYDHTGTPGTSTEITFNPPVVGDKVIVKLFGNQRILSLAEVQVFEAGTPTAPPTMAPTAFPTMAPTASPTRALTAFPTMAPTASPTQAPTASPTQAPTASPTMAPTASPTQAPTDSPTSSPTSSPVASLYATAVCGGAIKKCNPQTQVAPETATYGVRCCNDTEFPNSTMRDGCSVFAASKVGSGRKRCRKAATYQEAMEYCAASGARLCTQEELLGKCAKNTGCLLNDKLVWSSEPAH